MWQISPHTALRFNDITDEPLSKVKKVLQTSAEPLQIGVRVGAHCCMLYLLSLLGMLCLNTSLFGWVLPLLFLTSHCRTQYRFFWKCEGPQQ